MRINKVDSSYLASVGYDEKSKVLRARFSDGAIIDYFDVHPRTYKAVLTADSHGEAFIRLVRDKHTFEVIKQA